jgi:hypothetical protein
MRNTLKTLIGLLALIAVTGCDGKPKTSQSYMSNEYRQKCQAQCLEDFGTDLDWVGSLTGDCYCK